MAEAALVSHQGKWSFIPFQMHFIPYQSRNAIILVDYGYSQQDSGRESRGEQGDA